MLFLVLLPLQFLPTLKKKLYNRRGRGGGLKKQKIVRGCRAIYIKNTRAPHECLPAPMLRIGKYNSVPSRVILFKQVDINAPFDLIANGIGAMPSKWCREKAMPSFSSQYLYLSHSKYIPSCIPGSIFSGRYYCCLFQPSTLRPRKSELSILMG